MKRSPDPGAAREAAFIILDRIERSGAWASALLQQAEPRLADARDAALLHEIVLGVLRRRSALDHAVARVSHRESERIDAAVRTALRIGVYGLMFLDRVPDFAAVDSAVTLARRHAGPGRGGFVNGVLRAVARQGRALLPAPPRKGSIEGLALYHSHPAWWVRRAVERLGWDEAAALLEANNGPATTVLRVNDRRATVEQISEELSAGGHAARPGALDPRALYLDGPMGAVECLKQGRAWVQDEASQLVAQLLGPLPAPRMLDLCAAPGGKSFQLSRSLQDDGLLVAADRHEGRLGRMRRAKETIGAPGLVLLRADMAREPVPLRPVFDRVLVDAPCSGTGTLRRRPEIRWRLREEDLEAMAARQGRLLRSASRLLAPGGILVYSTCSLEPEEGEDVIESFLSDHPQFEVGDPAPWLPGPARACVGRSGYLRTSPAREGTDGFFAVRLCRAGQRGPGRL